MVATIQLERNAWKSRHDAPRLREDKMLESLTSKTMEVEISERLFALLPSRNLLRFCVDLGTRNGENFVGNTLITHSLLVSNDKKESDQRQGNESFVDNDHQHNQNTWFGVLLQPDARSFQSLYRLHRPLGNLCLQVSPSVEEGSKNDGSLQSILRRHVSDLPVDFDFLGLHEVGYSNYWILRKFLDQSSFRPKVVCIAYDNTLLEDIAFIPDRNNELELPSLRALVDLLSNYDYQMVVTTSRCAFFSRNDLYEGYLRHSFLGGLPFVSQQVNPINGYDRHTCQQESSSPKSHTEQNCSNAKFEEKYSNRTASVKKDTRNYDLYQSMMQSKNLPGGTQNRPETMGMKWLLDRRKTFENTTVTPLKDEAAFDKPKYFDSKNVVALRHPNSSSAAEFESRDDLVSLPHNSTSREDVVNAKHAGNIIDSGENSKNHIHGVKMMEHVPPDPIGDTISQKKKREKHESATEISIRRGNDSRDEIKIGIEGNNSLAPPSIKLQESVLGNINQSVVKLKQELLQFSQDDIIRNTDVSSGESLDKPNGHNGDLWPPKRVIVDLTALCGSIQRDNEEERLKCGKRLITELRQKGHALIRGTTISRFLCCDALHASHLILHECNEAARDSCRAESGILRGYTPKCTEKSGLSDLNDMVCKFRLGSHEGNAANKWPAEGTLDVESSEYIRASLQQYHDRINRVANLIMRSIFDITSRTTGSRNSESVLQPNTVAHNSDSSLLTMINCERGSRHGTGKPLIPSHTDSSLVTIVLVDDGDCANIQHQLSDGQWEEVGLPTVIPSDPLFMVYAGQSLRNLSEGLILSNPRRVVPSSGDQIMNGLLFSLMPPEPRASLCIGKVIENSDYGGFESPISKLTSELDDIDEIFQSFELLESRNDEFDFKKYDEETTTILRDPFIQDLEYAKKKRRNRFESLRLDEKKFYYDDQYKVSPSLIKNDLYRVKSAESSSKCDCQSSKSEEVEGQERKTIDQKTMNCCQDRGRSIYNHFPSQLLGSRQLPIIIETKTIEPSAQDVKVKTNDNFKHTMPSLNQNKNKNDFENTKSLLPVASPWNPPRRDLSKLKYDNREIKKTGNTTVEKGKRDRFIRSKRGKVKYSPKNSRQLKGLEPQRLKDTRVLFMNKIQEKQDDIPSQDSECTEKQKNTIHTARRNNSPTFKSLNSTQINTVQSSEASTILDEILGDRNLRSNVVRELPELYPDVDKIPSPQSSDPSFFQTCRESLSSNYLSKTQSQRILTMATTNQNKTLRRPHFPRNSGGKNSNLFKKSTARDNNNPGKNGGPKKLRHASGNYIPFRGSVVEWKMRENTKRKK